MKFMNKVGLLVDKGGVNYNSVDQKYAIRCDIAHGSFSTVGPVNILNEYLEFKRLLSALKPS